MHWQEKDLCFLFFLPPCTVFARRSMRDTADQVSPNIHQAMTLFDLVLWPFVSLGPQVLPWHILMKFLALASCYWRWDPCNLRCGCWKDFCLQQQGSAWFLGPKALGFFFFGQVDSALDSNPGPGFFCWRVKPLDVGVELCPLVGSCS